MYVDCHGLRPRNDGGLALLATSRNLRLLTDILLR